MAADGKDERVRTRQGIKAERLIEQLLAMREEGDHDGIVRALTREANRRAMGEEELDAGTQVVSIAVEGDVIRVRPEGPTIGDRQALIIRTEVNQELLMRQGQLKRVVVDLSRITVMSATVLRLFGDLKRNAKIFGAKTDGVGVPEEMAKSLRKLKLGQEKSRGPLLKLFSSS